MFQQTPLDVTVDPPALTTLPPQIADVFVIEVTALVVTDGTFWVVNDNSPPYDVPIPFVAYARTKYIVPGVKPDIVLVNEPIPVPFVVLVDKLIFGLGLVLQQTPRAVIFDPPEFVIFPPLIAVELVIEEIADVVKLGIDNVVKLT